MKYLKYFVEETQYEEFINSDEFIRPNVSHVSENKSMKYNPNNILDVFFIGDKEYQFENGMTWSEWLDSDYNVDNFYVSDGEVSPCIYLNSEFYIEESYEIDYPGFMEWNDNENAPHKDIPISKIISNYEYHLKRVNWPI
jgi:hypothetical protein